MKVLILFAHPAFEKSTVNKYISDGIHDIPDVKFHDLYEVYPEFDIEIEREQKLLKEHDCIIFQFPFFWYSTPAILKEWQDLVLQHDWAYGSKGNELKGKYIFNVISTGAPKNAYKKGGFHDYSMKELLAPLTQTARLCKMIPLPSFVIHGSHGLKKDDLRSYKMTYHELLKRFTEDKIDMKKVQKLDYLNSYLK